MPNRAIFLIEPDQIIRSMTAKHLVNNGYEVTISIRRITVND